MSFLCTRTFSLILSRITSQVHLSLFYVSRVVHCQVDPNKMINFNFQPRTLYFNSSNTNTTTTMLQHLWRTTRRTLTLHRTAPSRPLRTLFSQSRVVQVSAQQLSDKLRAKFPEHELIDVDDART